MRFAKTLQRVILLSLLVAYVSAAFWPFEKKQKAKKAAAAEIDEPDTVQAEPVKSKKKPQATKKSDTAKASNIRKKFATTAPNMLTPEDVKNAITTNAFQDTFGGEDAENITDTEITKMWTEHMHDFVPEDMVTFVLKDQKHKVLFETITHQIPRTIRGAYYVKGGNNVKSLSCIVLDPLKNVIYKRSSASQHIILFDSTVAGEYAFIFGNFGSREDLVVTMALHTYEENRDEPVEYDLDDAGNRIIRGSNKEESIPDEFQTYSDPEEIDESTAEFLDEHGNNKAASSDDISIVRNILRTAQTNIKQVQTEAKMSLTRQQSHNEDLLENTNWGVFAMILEVSVFCGILAFQLHHIKKSLDNKLIL